MNLPIELIVDAETINRTIAAAVAESAIGKTLKATIEKQVQSLANSYNNPLEQVVKEEILTLIRKVIEAEFRPQIEEAVRRQITAQFTDDLIGKLWTLWLETKYKER